jgi:hypothetical protein
MKKVFKILGIVLAVLVVGLGIFYFAANEPEPEGVKTSEADQWADKMMASVNKEAWDSTRYVTWNFADRHAFLWDKKEDIVQVTWSEFEVLLNTKNQQGAAFVKGQTVTGEKKNELLQKAWEYFCNDSFWFNAVVKAKDPGTVRSIVTLDDGRKGLKVTYQSGGVTPGDSYVWLMDENNRPTAYKMWVKIIPVGGVEFTWEDWKELPTGALVATKHVSDAFTLEMKDVKGGMQLSELGIEENPFSKM